MFLATKSEDSEKVINAIQLKQTITSGLLYDSMHTYFRALDCWQENKRTNFSAIFNLF